VDVGDEGVVTSLSGTWPRFERVDEYPLRPVADVYEDLKSGKWAEVMPLGPGAADTDVAESGAAGGDDDHATVLPEPADVPPLRVTVTGAELGTMLMSGFENDAMTTYAVPSYRFIGKYETGERWESELMALAPEYVTTPSTTVPPTEPAPEPVPVPEPGPDPSTDTTAPVVTPKDTGALQLYVSNQSFNIDPVDIVITLDGEQIVADDFAVEGQHNWQRFGVDVKPGTHKLAVTALDGSVKAEADIQIEAAATKYGVVNFWAECAPDGDLLDDCELDRKIEITLQDTQPVFM
jgi:hypothetical protein